MIECMERIAVIEQPEAAEAALDATRARLLRELAEPASASTLARRMEIPRQKLNYHLRALERHGLVELVEERRKGNCVERVLQASAAAYVISPAALGPDQPGPAADPPDRLSARWLLELAGRLVRDLGALITGADRQGARLGTFALEAEIAFDTPADRAAFAEELASEVTRLTAKHQATTAGGRSHRMVVALHPATKAAQPHNDENA